MHLLRQAAPAAFAFLLGTWPLGAIAQTKPSLEELMSTAGSLRSLEAFEQFDTQLRALGVGYAKTLPLITAANENLYVYVLQKAFTAEGTPLKASGMLNRSTTKAIVGYCKANALSCSSGLLSPETAAALGLSLDGASAVRSTDQTSIRSTETTAVAPSSPLALPEHWMLAPDADSGFTTAITDVTPTSALVHWQGVAKVSGFTNLYLGSSKPAAKGQNWTATVNVSDVKVLVAEGTEPLLHAFIRNQGKYVGEIKMPGTSLVSSPSRTTTFVLTGATPNSDVDEIGEYVQIMYKVGAKIDVEMRLSFPSLIQD